MADAGLRALIFDVDGTLAETEDLHRQAFNGAFAEAGLGWVWTRADYKRLLRTTGGKERIAAHMTACGLDPSTLDIAALHRAKTARYTALVADGALRLRPGVQRLIGQARAAGLRLGIATTTSLPNLDALCQAVWGKPAAATFEVIACGDEVPAKKPAPDIYTLALARLDLPAPAAIAFEDSRNGMLSARAAGLAVIVTPSTYSDDDNFAEATLVVPDLTALGGLDRITALAQHHADTSGISTP